jgi:hypothetical protein
VSPLTPVAVLDACVLFPIATTDALMSLGAAGFFRAKWTRRIEHEWMGALERRQPGLAGRLGIRRDAMRDAIPDWEIPKRAWLPLSTTISLPDPDDCHVVGAAIAAEADLIISANVADFPSDVLQPFGLRVSHPDAFIVELWSVDRRLWVQTFASMKRRLKRPELTPQEFAGAYERAGLPHTAQIVRSIADFL